MIRFGNHDNKPTYVDTKSKSIDPIIYIKSNGKFIPVKLYDMQKEAKKAKKENNASKKSNSKRSS